jgi:drug/metabolite transporter (DMT)-like permease
MGIALGLVAGVCWGLAEVVVSRATRQVKARWLVLGFHVLATAGLAIAVISTRALAPIAWTDLPLFVVLGVIGWISFIAYYSALGIGPISVVSPIVSGYAAITAIFAVVIGGERPKLAVTGAVVLTLTGVIVASLNFSQPADQAGGRHPRTGLLLALVALTGFGAFVYGVSYDARRLGWLAPIFLARALATVFLAGDLGLRRDLRWPSERRVALVSVVLLAFLDTTGYVAFNIGVRIAETAVVATASAPYAIIPILVGVLFMHERPTRTQIVGIVCVIAGLLALAAAG